MERISFPFTAIVGLEKLKLALIINVIDPNIGGLLIRGPKGTGKSTAVRALEDLLPEVEVVSDCPFHCNPRDPVYMCDRCRERVNRGEKLPIERRKMRIVTLPLGATEDRVIGSLDIEKAIKKGVEALKPGILAEANQNVLYIDEINLLPDHLVDDLLDVAASGWNIVEREGISVKHPAKFILIGTMNPEEGELRPQLLDRLPLSVTVKTPESVKERVEIVKRNIEFERDPVAFYEKYRGEQEKLRRRIAEARELLGKVVFPDYLLKAVSEMCVNLHVDGVRPDIVIYKAARALAAFKGKLVVGEDEVLLAAELALGHRTRRGGTLEPATPREVEKAFRAALEKVRVERKLEKAVLGKVVTGKHSSETVEVDGEGELDIREVGGGGRSRGRALVVGFKTLTPLLLMAMLILYTFFKLNPYLLVSNPANLILAGLIVSSLVVLSYLLLRNRFLVVGPGKEGKEKRFLSMSIARSFLTLTGDTLKRLVNSFKASDLFRGVYVISRLLSQELPAKALRIAFKERARGVARRVGKRLLSITGLQRGRVIGWRVPRGEPKDIHLVASVRAACLNMLKSHGHVKLPLRIEKDDLREKVRVYKRPVTVILVMDLSESMLVIARYVRDALTAFYMDVYRNKDRVGVIALKGGGAAVVQTPTTNVKAVIAKMARLGVSGLTPLAAGMLKALELVKLEKLKNPDVKPIVVLLTDGFTNVPLRQDPITGKERPPSSVFTTSHKDRAIEDVVYASILLKKRGIPVIVLNPDPTQLAYKVSDYDVAEVYKIACASGAFSGRTFLKEVDSRWDSIATGYVLTRLIAHLTGGTYLGFSEVCNL